MMGTATPPDRNQTITREDIEREIRLLENNASDCHVRTETVAMLRDIWARVEELEAKAKKDALDYLSDAGQLMEAVEEAHGNGRLQGLNEALAIDLDMEVDSTNGISAHLETVEAYKRAIEALKGETTND